LSRALDGQFPGDNGRPGDQKAGDAPNQSAGAIGGKISLFAGVVLGKVQLRANGGNGAKGQTGGNGQPGAQGQVGSHANGRNGPGNGGQGRPGGQGGVGGIGGPGGDSGQITLNVLDSHTQIGFTEALPGIAGDPGDPGAPGAGGIGGDPGNPCFFQAPHPGPRGDGGGGGGQACYDNKGQQGPVGLSGPPTPNQTGTPSPAKTHKPIVQSATPTLLGQWASIAQLRMLLQSAELSFLNGETDAIVSQLTWIAQLAESEHAGSEFSKMRSTWNAPQAIRAIQDQEWKTVSRSSRVLLARYSSGLNAFGYAPHYVSQLSFDFLKIQTQQFIDNATAVEASYEAWLASNNLLDIRRNAIAAASTKLASDIADLKNQASTQGALADKIQNEIAPLIATLDHLQNELLQAQAAFEEAVRAKGACSFLDMVKFVSGVIAIASGVYAGAGAIADAFEDANEQIDDDDNFIDSVKILAGTFKDSGATKDFAEMQQGYKDLQSSSKKQNEKLVVSLDSFEKQLEPFLDLPAARAYRDLLRSFVDITKTKNDKQVAYTQARVQSQTASSQAVKMAIEFAQTTTTLAQTSNPALEDEEQFLSSYLQTSKQWIMEMIDLKRRALMYKTLLSTPIILNFRDIKVVDLQTTSDKLDREWVSELNQMPGAGQTHPFQAVFTLSLSGSSDLKSLLTKNGEVVFTIPTDYSTFNRGGTSFVSVTEVALDLTGVSSKSNRFTAQLEHQGSSTFVNSDGRLMNFLHAPRLVNFDYNFTKGKWTEGEQGTQNNLGQSDSYYILLSPFSTWRLKIMSDTEVNWANVSHLSFRFAGTLIPRNNETSERLFVNHLKRLGRLNGSIVK